ncbi:MarR family winged helix-turn-helix transcriptional regulator [Lachnospiraceae bacterium 62-35]
MEKKRACWDGEKGNFSGAEEMRKCDNSQSVHRTMEQAVYVVRLHRMLLERLVKKTGVYRSQHQILMDIASFPKGSQKDIACRHHVSTATIAVSLKKLEKGGYIIREADKEDNRYNHISITPKGGAVIEESRHIFLEVENTIFAGFSLDEVSQFEGYLERMKKNLLNAVSITDKKE